MVSICLFCIENHRYGQTKHYIGRWRQCRGKLPGHCFRKPQHRHSGVLCRLVFHRLQVGYSVWTNPFSKVRSYVSYKDTRFIVFWSKNPHPLLPYLDILRGKGIGCYIQYTLNDYELERLETGVPPLVERIDTFKKLATRLGKEAVIWRFDPMLLTGNLSLDGLLDKVERIGDQLKGYTEKWCSAMPTSLTIER